MMFQQIKINLKCNFCGKRNNFSWIWITNSSNHLTIDYDHQCSFFEDLRIKITEKYDVDLERKKIFCKKKFLILLKIKDLEKLTILRIVKLKDILNEDGYEIVNNCLIFNNKRYMQDNELNNLLNFMLNLDIKISLELKKAYEFDHDFIIFVPISQYNYNIDEEKSLLLCSYCNDTYSIKNKKSVMRHKSKFGCKAKPHELIIDDDLLKEMMRY